MNGRELRARLRHVRFIGGASGAGKSTVAQRLARQWGLHLYDAEQFAAYARRTTPADAPLLHAFMAMDMDERWLTRSPAVMVETFHGFQGELFHLVLEDLLAQPPEPPVLAEGFTLLPRLVKPLLSHPQQAIWLLPSAEFYRAACESRGSTWGIPRRTSDPARALEQMRARNALFTDELRRQVAELDLPHIEVEAGLDLEALVPAVARALALQ